MATHTTPYLTPNQSTTGTLKRDVSDSIRHLWPGNPIHQLIASGMANKGQNVVRAKNMIGKRRVTTPKYEQFTFTPQAVEFTCAGDLSGTSLALSSATGLRQKYCVVNTTRGMTVARVSAISTNTITIQSIGDTAFDAKTGDKLLVLGPAYEENSSSPYIIMKDPDNLYNYTQIFRAPVAVSRTAKGNPNYGGNRWSNMKEENVVETLRRAAHSLLFSERAASTAQTTTDATLGDAFRTMRGVYNHAGTSHNMNGSMTWAKFRDEMPLSMDASVGTQTQKVMFMGTRAWSIVLGWVNDALEVQQNAGTYKQFGVESTRILTAKGPVEVVVVDAFDRADLGEMAIMFCPELLEYVTLRDFDFQPRNGIQNNDVDGTMDEIFSEISISTVDAGKSIMIVSNIY